MTALATDALMQRLPSPRDAAEAIVSGARTFGGDALRGDACIVLVRRY